MSPWTVMMSIVLILTPVICWVFTLNAPENRTPIRKIADVIHKQRYYLHALGYLIIIKWKGLTDDLNEPIKAVTGHWTASVHGLEGEFVLWVQDTFANPAFTAFLNFHYLFIYLFLIYVTTVFYAYTGERDLCDKVTLNYLLIYALAVPYYLFFNVEVTSSWIAGMDSLLYHDSMYSSFYIANDPLDNAVPSLHIAIPFGIIALNWLHVRDKGIKIREWVHWRYHLFVVVNTLLFAFTILYLGIHWVTDIPLGLAIGGLGALFIHYLQPRLRNDYGGWFEGVSKNKVKSHVLFEGIVVLVMVALISSAVLYQSNNVEDRVSLRLGPQDSNIEIIQSLGYDDQVNSTITNLDSSQEIEFISIVAQYSEPAMQSGYLNWSVARTLAEVHTLQPGEEATIIFDQPKVYQIIILHNPGDDGIVDVKIINDYGDDNSMLKAALLSLPSLWMTGFVLFRVIRAISNGKHWLDSTPSHTWAESE